MNRRRFVAGSLLGSLAGVAAASAFAPPLLIDSHVHVWKQDPRFPFAAGAKVPAGDFSAERLLELMAASGVSRTVLIQVIHYKWNNSYLADVLKQYPGKFQAVCRVNPESPTAPDDLSRLTDHGFRGVRLSPAAGPDGDWIRGPLMEPLWRRCEALKVPMTILAPITRMPDLLPLIERHPELTVVIDHMADSPLDPPEKLEMLLALAHFPRVFVKISHAWSLSKATISVSGFDVSDQTPSRCLHRRTPDVGHRLARIAKGTHLSQSRSVVPRSSGLDDNAGARDGALEDSTNSLAVRLMTLPGSSTKSTKVSSHRANRKRILVIKTSHNP